MKRNKLKGTQLDNFDRLGKKKRVEALTCIDLVEGTGSVIAEGSVISAHYTGAVCETGIIFQSSYDTNKPFVFELHEVIQGWKDGLIGMRVGGTRRLLIPSDMAYGRRRAAATIPPNSDLVFDIELLSVS
jgi:FKBP-type peptidyl-prolyl cis-trans isomerase